MFKKSIKPPFSLAEKTGFASLIISVFLFAVDPFFAVLPLVCFVCLSITAPFLPRFSFFLPVISRGARGVSAVALTFDDGPSPQSTPALLKLLDTYQLKATFFVIGEKAAAYPELIEDIVAKGHTVGNHSFRHDTFLMFRSYSGLKKDIESTQAVLQGLGIQPLVFRPPAGITNPRLKGVLAETKLTTVNFSCRIFDRGNKRIKGFADKVMSRLRPGDILMLHDTRPDQEDRNAYWLNEIERLFKFLQEEHTVLPLEDIINSPIMITDFGRSSV